MGACISNQAGSSAGSKETSNRLHSAFQDDGSLGQTQKVRESLLRLDWAPIWGAQRQLANNLHGRAQEDASRQRQLGEGRVSSCQAGPSSPSCCPLCSSAERRRELQACAAAIKKATLPSWSTLFSLSCPTCFPGTPSGGRTWRLVRVSCTHVLCMHVLYLRGVSTVQHWWLCHVP